MARINRLIPQEAIDKRLFATVSLDEGLALVEAIEPTLELLAGDSFEWEALKGLMRYYAEEGDGKIAILAQTGRRLRKSRSGDRSGISILGTDELRRLVRAPGRKAPALILLRQDGGPDLEWKSGPFWWPMLASTPDTKPCVFATKVAV
jgi:hypothetical protein